MAADSDTRVDRIIRRLKNNPVIAVLIVSAVIITATGTFWGELPRPVRDWAIDRWGTPQKDPTIYPETGWVFAGYVDKSDPMRWASDQRVTMTRQSAGQDRPEIFRKGDIVRPLKNVPQVIADYHTQGTRNQLLPPWQVVEVIRKSEDFTGRVYTATEDLEVMDVSVSALPDMDYAVWLRVTPIK